MGGEWSPFKASSPNARKSVGRLLQENMVFCIVILMATGFLMVMNATAGRGSDGSFPHYFAMKQFTWDVFALGCFLFVVTGLPLSKIRKYSWVLFAISILMLLMVLLVGQEINGAKRWFRFGMFSFQPSELAKIFSIVFFAHWLERQKTCIRSFHRGVLPVILTVLVLTGLIAMEPDLGNAALIFLVLIGMIWVAGARALHIFFIIVGLIPISVLFLYQQFDHFKSRIEVFLHPEAHVMAKGYQAQQALIALGSGGVSGKGLGQGIQKLFYLPEAHNDFIFAIIGEDFGFLGCSFLLVVYGLLVWYAIQVCVRAPNLFAQLLSFGLTALFAGQTLFNLGVVTRVFPNKGISLPLVSYGGSSVLFTMISLGILVRLAKTLPLDRPRELGAIRIKKRRPLF